MSEDPSSPSAERHAQLLALAGELRPALHRYCARLMGSVIDGEDVVQDTFARAFVARVAASNPKELTIEHSIAARGQRVYLDPFRNGFGQTVVAPYSIRRREKAPFSAPLAWSEVKPGLDPATFNLGNFRKRLKAKDPWADFFRNRQSLKDAAKSLKKL